MLTDNLSISRRTFLQNTTMLALLSVVRPLQPNRSSTRSAQPTAEDGYGLGTYNQGRYPAQRQNIYLPLITKGN